ncbi:hypothetical protein CapIbe_007642 [Capra ibex]
MACGWLCVFQLGSLGIPSRFLTSWQASEEPASCLGSPGPQTSGSVKLIFFPLIPGSGSGWKLLPEVTISRKHC